jgi:molybdate transport system permease protein
MGAEINTSNARSTQRQGGGSDAAFLAGLSIIGGLYLFLIVAMVLADTAFISPRHIWQALGSAEIRYAIRLSLISCSVAAILSLWVAVPLGYLMSRQQFAGKGLLDAILDIPIVLPPLVIGLSLLILFQFKIGSSTIDDFFNNRLGLPVTYAIPSVILAQFAVAAAFAVRTMRVTFDQINPRNEQVALTLGCTRRQAFWSVVLPEARRGVLTAATLAWARSLGEFGPILIFSGATRMKTEVLSTTVYLELSVGHIEAAVAVSLLMIAAAILVLLVLRFFGAEETFGKAV